MSVTNDDYWKVLAECGTSQAQLADMIIRLRRVIHAVEEEVDKLLSGEYATGSRDFGRGVAHAASAVAAALPGREGT